MTKDELAVYGAKTLRKELMTKLSEVNLFLNGGKQRFNKKILSKVKRIRRKNGGLTPKKMEWIRKMMKEGKTAYWMAKELKLNQSVVYRYVNMLKKGVDKT